MEEGFLITHVSIVHVQLYLIWCIFAMKPLYIFIFISILYIIFKSFFEKIGKFCRIFKKTASYKCESEALFLQIF